MFKKLNVNLPGDWLICVFKIQHSDIFISHFSSNLPNLHWPVSQDFFLLFGLDFVSLLEDQHMFGKPQSFRKSATAEKPAQAKGPASLVAQVKVETESSVIQCI